MAIPIFIVFVTYLEPFLNINYPSINNGMDTYTLKIDSLNSMHSLLLSLCTSFLNKEISSYNISIYKVKYQIL